MVSLHLPVSLFLSASLSLPPYISLLLPHQRRACLQPLFASLHLRLSASLCFSRLPLSAFLYLPSSLPCLSFIPSPLSACISPVHSLHILSSVSLLHPPPPSLSLPLSLSLSLSYPVHPSPSPLILQRMLSRPVTKTRSFVARREMRETVQLQKPTAKDCNRLQQTATDCNRLRPTTTNCTRLYSTATDCNRLQQTATDCNRLQQTATLCNRLQKTATECNRTQQNATNYNRLQPTTTNCTRLYSTATDRNRPQQTATDCTDRNRPQQTATDCNRPQQTATDCNRLQQTPASKTGSLRTSHAKALRLSESSSACPSRPSR